MKRVAIWICDLLNKATDGAVRSHYLTRKEIALAQRDAIHSTSKKVIDEWLIWCREATQMNDEVKPLIDIRRREWLGFTVLEKGIATEFTRLVAKENQDQ